ncbi:MAG: glucosaminidase domain-containing protein [Oceanospirillaceae bacterium]|nr:glucosaminidase domain-containing protein [Oceanospirillaceae bacterium]
MPSIRTPLLLTIPLLVVATTFAMTTRKPPVHMPDFAAIEDIATRKQAFMDFIYPYVAIENKKILRERQQLRRILNSIEKGENLRQSQLDKLVRLGLRYRVPGTDNPTDPEYLSILLRRIDVIPPSLAIAQAANESAWGTSRFAREGYNFFGQWCFSEGCGLVPNRRQKGKTHEVAAFENPQAAIASYMRNLNTQSAYTDMRIKRSDMRQNREGINGVHVAEGLGAYSTRADAYIRDIQGMIRYNGLRQYDVKMNAALNIAI